MKGYLCCAGVLAAGLLAAVPAQAQGFNPWQGGPMPPPGYGPMPYGCVAPRAPSTCGPGFYSTNCCGATYGPCYCLRPPFPPFQGARPNVGASGGAGGGPAGIAGFPAHLYIRSPRDFFMVGDP